MGSSEGRPSASVIIPVYNGGSTLSGQLDAIISQTGGQVLEIIVSDNGSTDRTRDIALTRASEGVRVVDASARPGASAARNIGALAAEGDVLLFCDADDVVADGWAAALIQALSRADLVAGVKEGRSLNLANRASVSWESSAEIRMPYWPRFEAGSSSNLGIRADVFSAISGFDENLSASEDVDLCWRAQIAGYSFHRVPSAVVHTRQRDGRVAVFRQGFAYAAGERAMRRKYAEYIEQDRGVEFAGGAIDRESVEHEPVRTPAQRLARLLTPPGQANLAWRVGQSLGRRFGRVDPAVQALPARP